jgi:hypothetical protein
MTDKCKKCDGELFESENLSRCLKCLTSTERELHGEIHFKKRMEYKELSLKILGRVGE